MVRFKVPDMSCSHCVSTITKAVKAQDPQARVEIDLEQHSVGIESALPAARLQHEIEEAGYTPTLQA